MKPKKFQEANVVYGEGQPEYKPLPAFYPILLQSYPPL